MLLNVCEFHENRHWKGRTFTVGVNKIAFMLLP